MDIKRFDIEQLKNLCIDIRTKIIEVVSHNGGHLSSNMGAVELVVAMHYVFDAEKDPFIFDVSHQSYTHKLLTQRWDKFDTLRQIDGISGYTRPSESPYDYFVAGHSSTSISLAVGAAKAIALKNEEDRIPVALIGDGAMSAGMAYEALNELGDRKYPVVIILNDNEMSISKPIGAISKYLSQAMAGQFYQKFKSRVEKVLDFLPEPATYMAKRFEEGFKLITPGMLFEELGLEYIGPIDGHNLSTIISTLKTAKKLKKPVIVHAQTIKGKGYVKAEGQFEKWHGVAPFDIESGEPVLTKTSNKSATALFSEALLCLAKSKNNVVGVTAAMPSGTGMDKLIREFPDRFWDVAIAEQHAVTSMCAMAKEGFKPFIAIYSTFLQRAYDQVIHDACLMNLSVVFAIDRAGIVGEDGETHQGAFDISYLNAIPNITLFAPRDDVGMKYAVEFAYEHKGVCAFRYPRGNFISCEETKSKPFSLGQGEVLHKGKSDIVFVGYGNGVGKACECAKLLNEDISIIDLRFIKPLDQELLRKVALKCKKWYIFSDSAKRGGVGEILLGFLSEQKIDGITLESFEYEDSFIPHGDNFDIEEKLGISAKKIVEKIIKRNHKKY
ncbi:MAG: 1-deoxy-D-xylulose-5-phosphate synthase [Campylobacteraceae bacterium]|nr:1-deoxy-D-xylulose-5-phosphate synthase [Campylobacteraceae bacterium]